MVHASVQIDQLHPPMSEPLKGIDLRWIDDVLDYAGDHTRSVTNWLDSEGVLDLRRKLRRVRSLAWPCASRQVSVCRRAGRVTFDR